MTTPSVAFATPATNTSTWGTKLSVPTWTSASRASTVAITTHSASTKSERTPVNAIQGLLEMAEFAKTNTPAKASNVLKMPSVSRAIAWRCVDVAKASREMVRRVQLWWIKAVTPTTTVTNLVSVPLIHKRIVTIVLVYQVTKEMDTGAEKSQSKMLRKLRYKKRYRDVFLESVGVQKVTPAKRGRRIVFPKGKKQHQFFQKLQLMQMVCVESFGQVL
jgi:hypothetical protein